MFEWLFKCKHAIQRHLKAPLLQERLMYLQYWYDNGATFNTLRRYASFLLVIVKMLKLKTSRVISIEEITKAAEKLSSSSTHYSRNRCSKNARNFKSIAIGWLHMLDRLKYPDEEVNISSKLITEYTSYMRLERGLSENSIYVYVAILRDFFDNIGRNTPLSRLNISAVDKILDTKYRLNGYHRTSIKSYASAVRLFLKYAEGRNLCQKGLASLIKIPRVYQDEAIPKGPSWNEVTQLLKSTEGDHPIDIRDHAILMLLAIYGLRCSEVVKLRLEDLDWKNEILHIRRSKNAKPQRFPLSQMIGNAIIRYLKEVRPCNCLHREVFIARKAPYGPLTSSAIYMIVSVRLKAINVNLKHYGPHSLRHACATHLINEGISLKVISDHLGHQNLESTQIYAKVDLTNLRKVAADFEIGDLI